MRARADWSEAHGSGARGEGTKVDPDLAHERIYIRLLPLIKQSQKDSNGATPHSPSPSFACPLSLALTLSRILLHFLPRHPHSVAASFVYHLPSSRRGRI